VSDSSRCPTSLPPNATPTPLTPPTPDSLPAHAGPSCLERQTRCAPLCDPLSQSLRHPSPVPGALGSQPCRCPASRQVMGSPCPGTAMRRPSSTYMGLPSPILVLVHPLFALSQPFVLFSLCLRRSGTATRIFVAVSLTGLLFATPSLSSGFH
jgi:hypothetical protein